MTSLSAWESKQVVEHQGKALGVLLTLAEGPILEDPEGVEDEFGCRDGLDGIAMGAGISREDIEVGLWCLDRLGWAKRHGKHWTRTDAAPLLAVEGDAPIVRRQYQIARERIAEVVTR